ncbi:hypothetical protein Cgig2_014374 [Carnegiea gigantea]|uniref:WAT1-related protein n=1 Tax=Carnegiea gigantea TaxID=171969 RepID=A0A9Q1KE95_9CARY|nr:hypothetical protein Cgig2_014374 [Carnegiea gigantea]
MEGPAWQFFPCAADTLNNMVCMNMKARGSEYEKRLRSLAKIEGTAICASGAVAMPLLRGPKLLNTENPLPNSLLPQPLGSRDQTWLLGCLCLFSCTCCRSLWLILHVNPRRGNLKKKKKRKAWRSCQSYLIRISYVKMNRLCIQHNTFITYLSPLGCYVSMLQAGIIALSLEPDLTAWSLTSILEFSSLPGAIAVIIGVCGILWGKSEEINPVPGNSADEIVEEKTSSKVDLKQPLLMDGYSNEDGEHMDS